MSFSQRPSVNLMFSIPGTYTIYFNYVQSGSVKSKKLNNNTSFLTNYIYLNEEPLERGCRPLHREPGCIPVPAQCHFSVSSPPDDTTRSILSPPSALSPLSVLRGLIPFSSAQPVLLPKNFRKAYTLNIGGVDFPVLKKHTPQL